MENEKKEYLNEESYNKNKKMLIIIAVVIFIIGLVIGGFLITKGIQKQKNNDNVTTTASNENSNRTKEDIQKEIDTLNTELSALKSQEDQEFQNNGFSEKYYSLDSEIDSKEDKISNLKKEIWESESGYNQAKSDINKTKSVVGVAPYYMFGGFIIFVSVGISIGIIVFAKKREILAFSAQQVMPVAQEGMEKMAPTVGNVANTVAKGIASGIKEGLNDEESNK